MAPPLVSVVTATYNRARYLGSAIASVRVQTYDRWEHVVADDGSQDETPAVVAAVMAEDPRIRYVRFEHMGYPAILNAALEHARGELVAFLADDDLYQPEKLAAQVPAFERSDVGWAYADSAVVNEAGEQLHGALIGEGLIALPPRAGGRIFEDLLNGCHILGNTVMVRRECLREVGAFDPAAVGMEDWDLWLRLAARYLVHYDPRPLAAYRWHPQNISKDVERMRRGYRYVLEKSFGPGGIATIGRSPRSVRRLRRAAYARFHYLMAEAEWNHAWDVAAARRSLLRSLAHGPRRHAPLRRMLGLSIKLALPEAVSFWLRRRSATARRPPVVEL